MIVRSWNSSGSAKVFWTKRAFRLAPPLLASFVLVGVLFGATEAGMAVLTWLSFGIVESRNAPLWSLGPEEVAYLTLAALSALSLVNRRTAITAAVASCVIGSLVPLNTYTALVPAFVLGVAWSYQPLKIDWRITLSLAAGLFPLVEIAPWLNSFRLIVCCVLVLQVGQLRVAKPKEREMTDYSYGLYIYHAPIMLWLMAQGVTGPTWWLSTIGLSFAAAWLSHRYLEAPAERLKRRLLDRWRQSSPQTLPNHVGQLPVCNSPVLEPAG